MSFKEELKAIDRDRFLTVFESVFSQLSSFAEEFPVIPEGYDLLHELTSRAYARYEEVKELRDSGIEMDDELYGELKGINLGIWATLAVFTRYAETENFELEDLLKDDPEET